jgi:hypothetical protein
MAAAAFNQGPHKRRPRRRARETQMLRTLVFALAVGASGAAMADQFPQSALHADVRADDGTVVGRVEAVERDSEGRIVAAEISGTEPASAPLASEDLMVEARSERVTRVVDRRLEGSNAPASRVE